MPADVGRRKLPTLKGHLQENMEMSNETVRGVLEEIKDYVEKGECVARHIQDRHRNTLNIAASLQNLTIQYRRLVNDVNQQRISLAIMASLMQDAMASLVHGYLPLALILPTILSKILDTVEVYGLNEAIPRKLIAAYYTLEVVRDVYISDEGLHLLIEIPLYRGHGVHDVFPATPVPQPIPQTNVRHNTTIRKRTYLCHVTKRILRKSPSKNSPPIVKARTGYGYVNNRSRQLSRRRRLA